MRPRSAWRLIVDGPGDAAWNMAVDEALLESIDATPDAPPTVRLYGWCPAALSLGRGQVASEAHDGAALARLGIDLVRRPTGGDAVLHEHERTVALAGSLRRPPFPGGILDTYRRFASAVCAALGRLGVEAEATAPSSASAGRRGSVCFETLGAHEIAAAGRKIAGFAQRRRRNAFLLHGSLPIRLDPARLAAAAGRAVRRERFGDLESVAGAPIDGEQLDRALVWGLEQVCGADFDVGGLSEAEALRAAELRCWKYDSMSWTLDGRIGAREARWGPAIAP